MLFETCIEDIIYLLMSLSFLQYLLECFSCIKELIFTITFSAMSEKDSSYGPAMHVVLVRENLLYLNLALFAN